MDFFIKFIGYIIEKKDEKKEEKKEEKQDKKKEEKKVEKRVDLEKGLNYIKDLETFLKVIEAKKEDIFEKYNSKKIEKIITLEDLKFKKNFMETEEDEQQLTENSKGNILSIKTTETEKENTEEIDPLKKKKQEKKRIEELIKILNSIIDFCEDKKNISNSFHWEFLEICFKLL